MLFRGWKQTSPLSWSAINAAIVVDAAGTNPKLLGKEVDLVGPRGGPEVLWALSQTGFKGSKQQIITDTVHTVHFHFLKFSMTPLQGP